MLLRQLIGYALWIPGGFAVTAALILALVSFRLSQRGQAAEAWPRRDCAQVRAGSGPLHLYGASAPGPAGLLRGCLSQAECVWYRERVFRRYWMTRMRLTHEGDWAEVTEPAQELIWEWDSGPFALRDETGSVLIAPALLERTLNAAGHPAQQVVDEVRDSGGAAWPDQSGALGALRAHGLLPAGLLDSFAQPDAQTFGYRVQEEILRPGMSFRVFAVPADLPGEPIMAMPFQDVWAISAEPMPTALARGGKRGMAWAAWMGLGGLACFAVSVLLLLPVTQAPG